MMAAGNGKAWLRRPNFDRTDSHLDESLGKTRATTLNGERESEVKSWDRGKRKPL
jgi:hypothetical protein